VSVPGAAPYSTAPVESTVVVHTIVVCVEVVDCRYG
jgi:hypothetical protein